MPNGVGELVKQQGLGMGTGGLALVMVMYLFTQSAVDPDRLEDTLDEIQDSMERVEDEVREIRRGYDTDHELFERNHQLLRLICMNVAKTEESRRQCISH